jgi:hypothetical protein
MYAARVCGMQTGFSVKRAARGANCGHNTLGMKYPGARRDKEEQNIDEPNLKHIIELMH